ncbi:MAG: hypothetical protein OXI29_00145 [bacterium]|nr:hypothetical protein [bacterium]
MAKSESAEARDWITGLEPGTWFWSQEVPGRRDIAHPVLSRLSNDEASGVQRIAKGLYWRGWPEGQEGFLMPPNYGVGGLLLAGDGAGFADWTALNRLRWTTQRPCKILISTLGASPKPPHPTVVYRPRRNHRRAELNWTEVTVLEAVSVFWMSEEPWHECLDKIRSGVSMRCLPWCAPIRPDKLRWAAETEDEATVDALHLLQEVSSEIDKMAAVV